MLVDVDPQPSELARQVAEPVALLGADEPDATDARRAVRAGGHDGHGGHEVGHVGHVDVDATQTGAAGDGDPAAGAGDPAAHRREQVGEPGVALQRPDPETRHRDRPADNCRKCQRVARR